MKINRKLIQRYDRLANYYRYRTTNRAKDRHDIQTSKSKHPSRSRSHDRKQTAMETSNDR